MSEEKAEYGTDKETLERLAEGALGRASKLPEKKWSFEWEQEVGDYGVVLSSSPTIRGLGFVEFTDWHEENEAKEPQILEFIARARFDVAQLARAVLSLLEENEQLQDKVAELEAELSQARRRIDTLARKGVLLQNELARKDEAVRRGIEQLEGWYPDEAVEKALPWFHKALKEEEE